MLSLVLLTVPVSAEVVVDAEHRIKNMGYGVCAWSSIETAGRTLGIDPLNGLAKKRDVESRTKVRKWAHANVNGIVTLVVVEEELRNNAADIESMRRQLDALGVKYDSQIENDFDTAILYRGTKDGEGGVIVGIFNYAYTRPEKKIKGYWEYNESSEEAKGYHAVLLTDINDEYVKFIDSNDVSAPWIATRKWFDKHWDGAGMILIKPVTKKPVKEVEIEPEQKDDQTLIDRLLTDPKRKKK